MRITSELMSIRLYNCFQIGEMIEHHPNFEPHFVLKVPIFRVCTKFCNFLIAGVNQRELKTKVSTLQVYVCVWVITQKRLN